MGAILRVRGQNGEIIEIPAIRGKSAYATAVEYGFVGTEEEFGKQLNLENYYKKDEIDELVAGAGKVKTVNGVEPDADGNIDLSSDFEAIDTKLSSQIVRNEADATADTKIVINAEEGEYVEVPSIEDIPTKVSQLENDAKYITSENVSSIISVDEDNEDSKLIIKTEAEEIEVPTMDDIPTKLSQLEADIELGSVKTVNGVAPDDEGNINVEYDDSKIVDGLSQFGTFDDDGNFVPNKNLKIHTFEEFIDNPLITDEFYFRLTGANRTYQIIVTAKSCLNEPFAVYIPQGILQGRIYKPRDGYDYTNITSGASNLLDEAGRTIPPNMMSFSSACILLINNMPSINRLHISYIGYGVSYYITTRDEQFYDVAYSVPYFNSPYKALSFVPTHPYDPATKKYVDEAVASVQQETITDTQILQAIIDSDLFTDILATNGVIYTDDNGKVVVI